MNARRYHIKKTFISIMGQPHSKHPANDENGEVEASKMWSAATTRQWDNRSRWSKRNWEEYITGRVLLFLFTFHHSDINSRGSRCSYYVSSIVSGRHQRKWESIDSVFGLLPHYGKSKTRIRKVLVVLLASAWIPEITLLSWGNWKN